jgi:hypothetical protein
VCAVGEREVIGLSDRGMAVRRRGGRPRTRTSVDLTHPAEGAVDLTHL